VGPFSRGPVGPLARHPLSVGPFFESTGERDTG